MDADRTDGQKHGGHFSDDHAGCRNGNGQLPAALQGGQGDQVDASHPHKLFHELCRCRNGGFAQSVKIAVDAGMDGGEREGEGGDAQQRRAAGLKKKPFRDKVGSGENDCRAKKGRGQGKQKPHKKHPDAGPAVMGGFLSRCKFGNRILKPCGAEGENQRHHRADELIDADIFFPKQAREKDAVKKTDQTADKPCDG